MSPTVRDITKVAQALRSRGADCRLNVALREITTFQLGGACPLLVDCSTESVLLAVLHYFIQHDISWRLMGGGSNLLVADSGVDEVVVRYVQTAECASFQTKKEQVTVAGAWPLDQLVARMTELGLAGLERASGIPGTVGGALNGNAGAFGWQLADALLQVRVMTPDGEILTLQPEQLDFTYRDSGIKRRGLVVLAAVFHSTPGDRDALRAERKHILQQRRERHPDWRHTPCAGSFFRNIQASSAAGRRQAAGYFLEQVGGKEMRQGGAAVFAGHANILIKATPNCTSRDVFLLSQRLAAAVQQQFGLLLKREVNLWGKFQDATQ